MLLWGITLKGHETINVQAFQSIQVGQKQHQCRKMWHLYFVPHTPKPQTWYLTYAYSLQTLFMLEILGEKNTKNLLAILLVVVAKGNYDANNRHSLAIQLDFMQTYCWYPRLCTQSMCHVSCKISCSWTNIIVTAITIRYRAVMYTITTSQ